jgi:hypothetical protein
MINDKIDSLQKFCASKENKIPLFLFCLVLLVGTISAVFLLNQDIYSLSYYGDANSRLVQTRLLFDSENPGIHRFGTVWLPLPQILFLPFTAVDKLYYYGLSGFVVNMILLSFSTVYIYKTIKELTGKISISITIGLLFGLNPNMLYSSMTTMTETTSLFFIIGAIYYLQNWLKQDKPLENLQDLLKISLFLTGATLCRYESYLMVPFFFLIVFYIIIVHKEIPDIKKLIFYTLISTFGILIWLLWNKLKFGDAFYFSNAEYYSAAWQAKHRDVSKGLASQLGNVLGIYTVTSLAIFGVILPIFSIIGIFKNHGFKIKYAKILFYTFSLIAVFTTLYSMYNGVAEMTFWWNSRYALLMSPFLMISAAMGLNHLFSLKETNNYVKILIICLLFSMYIIQLSISRFGVVTYADAIGGFLWKQTPKAVEIGEELRSKYLSGKILVATGSAQAQRILQTSRIDGKIFHIALNKEKNEPWTQELINNFQWVIISKTPDDDSSEIAKLLMNSFEIINKKFNITFDNEYFILMQKK